MSGGGGCAAGGFDELWLVLLSVGSLLEMDSNMQHDDDSQIHSDTIGCQSQTPTNPRQGNSNICSVQFGLKPGIKCSLKHVVCVLTVYDSNDTV